MKLASSSRLTALRGTAALALSLLGAAACSDAAAPAVHEAVASDEAAASTCRETINTFRELLVVDPAIIDDPVRTSNGANGKPVGAWSFRNIVEQMAPTAATAPEFVKTWLEQWGNVTEVDGHPVEPRQAMVFNILNSWPKINGRLQLDQSPFKLIAIVNRMDLRTPSKPSGEGRFVFAVTSQQTSGSQPPFNRAFTVIFEYKLPTVGTKTTEWWASKWHGLGKGGRTLSPAALQEVTDAFVARNSLPGAPNGNAISQVRTNEIDLGSPWELREFHLDGATGQLKHALVGNTPDLRFNANHFVFTPDHPGIGTLASWINDPVNRPAILSQTHELPGTALTGAFSHQDGITWGFAGVGDEDLRHNMARQTCSGCHNGEPVDSQRGVMNIDGFYHITPSTRPTGDGSNVVSEFMKQVDLPARAEHLKMLVCAGGRIPAPKANGRVH